MKKLFVYSNQNDNNSLGQLAHILINNGFSGFNVELTRLTFTESEENINYLRERITNVIKNEVHFISVR
jgi:hypothetical protein